MNSVRDWVYAYWCYQETMWTVHLWSGYYKTGSSGWVEKQKEWILVRWRKKPLWRCSSGQQRKTEKKTKEGELATAAGITKDVYNKAVACQVVWSLWYNLNFQPHCRSTSFQPEFSCPGLQLDLITRNLLLVLFPACEMSALKIASICSTTTHQETLNLLWV